MNILLLADTGHHTSAVQDHIQAIITGSNYAWQIENPLLCKTLHKYDLSKFDAIGIHYSIKIHSTYYLPLALQTALRQYSGIKFVFLQDEYANPNRNVAAMTDLKIDLLFTLLLPEQIEKGYPDLAEKNIKAIPVLTGYVTEAMKTLPYLPIQERKIDIFYRSRVYPYWLGKLAQERSILAKEITKRAFNFNLQIDISLKESERIYGKEWLTRLQSTKAVLGTESGASIWDFDGLIEKSVKARLASDPELDFNIIQDELLAQHENKVGYAAISPRCFEAAATRSAMILFPGFYNGILEKNKHYICLEKDFSNFEEVVTQLNDIEYLENLVETVYQDIILSGKYDHTQLAGIIDQALLNLTLTKTTKFRAEIIHEEIKTLKSRTRILNFLYCFLAETKFIKNNFLTLWQNEQYKGSKKFFALYHGAKRYLTYFKARLIRKTIKLHRTL